MDRLWLLAGLCQVVLLTYEQHLNPVEVEVAFQSFSSTKDADTYSVTCRTASNRLVHAELIDRSACSPYCKVTLLLVEDPRGYNITQGANRMDTALEARTFHFIPVSLSSLRMYSTATTAVLTWKLRPHESLSTLTLRDAGGQSESLPRVFNIDSSEAESQHELKHLRPATRFTSQVVVTTSLEHLNVTLKQRLDVVTETARCPSDWMADGGSCYVVKREALAWSEARRGCRGSAPGGHLADLKTPEDLRLISSHLLNHNDPLLLWTGLSDQQQEGRPLWSDGSAYSRTDAVMSSLPANETDCFALQRDATGPGHFLTPFFCYIPLPFICQSNIPSVSASFSFHLAQVTEHQVELRWSDLSPLNTLSLTSFEVSLQYQEGGKRESSQVEEEIGGKTAVETGKPSRDGVKKVVRVPISLSSRGVTVAGLYPGSVYSFTLRASYPAGSTWSLGQTQTAYTRPLPPQNITVGPITVSQITVHWMLMDAQSSVGWTFIVHCVDTSTSQEKLVGMRNISVLAETGGSLSYTAVIGGLESYRKHRVEVCTVTQRGIESCGEAPVTLRTAVRPPSGLEVLSDSGNMTVCWTSPPDDTPDGYYITSLPLMDPTPTPLWINGSRPGALWVNRSACVHLGTFTPGQTYEVGVVSLRGRDRSERTSITHTTDPMPIQIAVPLSAGTTSAQLYVQRSQQGLMDGVKVCVCPAVCDSACEGLCTYPCDRYSLPDGVHIITLGDLSPGSEYRLKVSSTSLGRVGQPYYTRPFRTGLAPPNRVREGLVTDSSIELLWDPAQGQNHSYEVLCLECDHSHMVQKVWSQSATFSSLTPGKLYRFVVRTEKSSFADSSPATINITAAPSPVEVSVFNKTTSSITIQWGITSEGVIGLILSIENKTSKQELIVSHQGPRSYSFEGLAPGSQYTIEVTTTSRERKSTPASLILHTIPQAPQEVTHSEQAVTSVFVTWRPPPGRAETYEVTLYISLSRTKEASYIKFPHSPAGYLATVISTPQLVYGLLATDRKSHIKVFVRETSYEIRDLIPGSDYGFSIRSVLGTDFSEAVHREFSTRPAGLCALRLGHVNSSSVSVSWDGADGDFDSHRVTVAHASASRTLAVPKRERVAVLTGLLDGCSYNVSAQRVRGGTVGRAASLTVTTVPARVRGVRVVNVTARGFSLRWEKSVGCVDRYLVKLQPSRGVTVTVHPARDGYVQADVTNVSPGTQYTALVTAVSSSNISPGVSRMINTTRRDTSRAAAPVPDKPIDLKGDASGSNGILLSWTVTNDDITGYVIRYKEVCPYPDADFTVASKQEDLTEILLTDFTSGSTYHIEVAASSDAGTGAFSKALYIKTAESPPGLVTNLTAEARNHTFVMVTWFLPHRINGLITKFAVKARHTRMSLVRSLEVNAESIMSGALPHCNDAADILSRATVSPLEMTASSPPSTLSAVPPAASWSVPISVGVDQLRPYTSYLFEVSAFTSEGEGQVASAMVRMPEAAPEDPPQDFSILNVTSRSISVSWNSPSIITGKFTYMLYLNGDFMYENSPGDMRFAFTDLTPHTMYTVAVRAKAAGEAGPAAEADVVTTAEAPSAVQALVAKAEDSVSIRVSWKSPAEPNGLITQYRLLVLLDATLLQDITLMAEENATGVYENDDDDDSSSSGRRKRSVDPSTVTSAPTFTATLSLRTGLTASVLTRSGRSVTDTDTDTDTGTNAQTNPDPTATEMYASGSHSGATDIIQSTDPSATFFGTSSALSITSAQPATPPPWLTEAITEEDEDEDVTTDSLSPSALTPGRLRLSTRDASTITERFSTRNTAFPGTTGVTVREEVMDVSSEKLSYLVSELNPFTEYTFRLSASTTVGEGPPLDITEKTREQVPSSVLDVSYQNVSSTSIHVSWVPPLNPNGRITHYTVYLKVHNSQELKWNTNDTSILITDLDKYTGYKLRVGASTAVGESSLSDEDYIFVFTLEDEPDSPPVNLSVVDTSPSVATLAWAAPERANGVIQRYQVRYENQSYSALVNSSSNRVTLVNLRPFSYYNVSVRAYTSLGHGNQTSDTLHLLSGEDVPGSPPYGVAYEPVSPSEVNVTWQPPLVPNGVITHYSLELWNSSHYLNLNTSTNHVHLTHLRKYAQYRVTVQAHTRVGPGNYSSEPLNITTLEDAPDTPPQFLHARKLSDYEVQLSWQPPLESNSDILYYVVRVWNETTEMWQNVTGTSVVLNVDSESPYNASVSSWTRLGDGGVLIYITFTTSVAEPFDPPQNVTFANATTSSVSLLWHRPTEPNGIIVHYSIYYEDDNGTVNEQRVLASDLPALASPDSTHSYTLSGLTGGTNYTVWMSSSTAQGDGGVHSQPLHLLLPEDVPGDSVHNLTVRIFSSTSVIVQWDPPMEPNGRLTYLVTLEEAGDLPPVNKPVRRKTTNDIELFAGLRKYFPYRLTITPATAAGAAYNHTSTRHLRTAEDLPSSAPVLVSTRNLSSSSIAVVWQRPLEANGEITEYTLTLSGPGGSNTTHTPNTSVVLTGLLPYTAYNLSVVAATRIGSGPNLMLYLHTDEGGPMSPPRNLTIYNHTAVSVWLSWEPPLDPNGVVIRYGFSIRDLNTHAVTYKNSSGPSTTEYVSGFRPHSSYEITVYSYTRVGHGNQFSSPVTFTTNESVSDAVGNLSCAGVSWDSVQMSWELPANPNGQILFYEVMLEVDSRSYTHRADEPEYMVTGLPPDQVFDLTVVAVNSAGPGDGLNCTASTLSESVPAAPRSLSVSQVTPDNLTLRWAPPLSVPGLLREYRVVAQLLSKACEPDALSDPHLAPEDDLLTSSDCSVDSDSTVSVNASHGHSVTIRGPAKYRYYRFKVAAVTNAGVGEYTGWEYKHTLPGNPDAPPRDLQVTLSSNSLRIAWSAPDVLSGPTSYLVQVDGPDFNISTVRAPEELMTVVVTNLTAFTRYSVTITAFTGSLEQAAFDGKAVGPFVFLTLEEEPKDPPKNVNVSVIPKEVNRVKVTFAPPEEPNGNITAYFVYIYEKDRLVKNTSLNITQRDHNNMITAVIEGLKGGHNYTIQISAKNGAGRSPPSPPVQITTGIKAPAKPTRRPQAMLGHGGVAMVTHRSITIRMPACFYSDDNGPITKIQVIVAESGVKDVQNLTNWKSAYFDRPAPYLTDGGFPNPLCHLGDEASRTDTHVSRGGGGGGGGGGASQDGRSPVSRNHTAGTYVIGLNKACMEENNTDHYCNGPLKPNTVYVFKFRGTNTNGQSTDSEYSEHIKTKVDGLLTREQQIILGVVLSFFLALLLILIICCSVKIHQRKKEGGTYSPREAEIIETKLKLDQLIAVADLELKQEKPNLYPSLFFKRKEIYVIQLLSYRKSLKPVNKKSFLQHVEDLCNNDNAKFQEEFAELPKLLQDLATSDADLPWNKSKNRFPNIKPYNNNRVKLLSEPGTAGSDYINASFVSGYLCPNEFIATQGPLPGTVADFWRMIWETGTRTIAMLTQCYEKGRIRCHKYWPEDNKPMSVFSDILISKVSEEVRPDWTVRTLKVEKHGHCIMVRHFNYTSWPEHGVPESCSTLITFVKAVRAQRQDNTTIVAHCSAGVGRTGVFIALDHLIQHVRDHDFVDVYGLVAELRSERMCMVQNLAQYIFLHQSTLELLNNKGNIQSIWFVNYSALEKMDSLDAMEGDVELEWEETTM